MKSTTVPGLSEFGQSRVRPLANEGLVVLSALDRDDVVTGPTDLFVQRNDAADVIVVVIVIVIVG